MSALHETSQIVLHRCRELGFALAGICDAAPTSYRQELIDWLAAGKHGEMEYLQRNTELRIDPCAMLPGARSMICVADRYSSSLALGEGSGERTNSVIVEPSPQASPRRTGSVAVGRIARYARGNDYHVVLRKRLKLLCQHLQAMFPDEAFRPCVDTAPVLEREHAQRAGLGAVGKNTLLIHRGVSSYLLLGEIITTLALEASQPAAPDPCSTCTRCIDACPTGAITPWSIDATKCISYLTIEHRGLIDERYHTAIGDWLFGCDICQEVCPHNQQTLRRRQREGDVLDDYLPRRSEFDLIEVLSWDEQARTQAFLKSSMKRAKLDMMKRNALIAAGNALRRRDEPPLRSRLEQIAVDETESTLVRQTAGQVLTSL